MASWPTTRILRCGSVRSRRQPCAGLRSERLIGHHPRNDQRSVRRRVARSDGNPHESCAPGARACPGHRCRRPIPVRRPSRRHLSPEVRIDRLQHADSRRSSTDRRFHRARRREHESRRDGGVGHRQRAEPRRRHHEHERERGVHERDSRLRAARPRSSERPRDGAGRDPGAGRRRRQHAGAAAGYGELRHGGAAEAPVPKA